MSVNFPLSKIPNNVNGTITDKQDVPPHRHVPMQRSVSLPTPAFLASILGREVPLCGPNFLQL